MNLQTLKPRARPCRGHLGDYWKVTFPDTPKYVAVDTSLDGAIRQAHRVRLYCMGAWTK